MGDTTRPRRSGDRARAPRPKPGAKRDQIIDVAAEYFGRDGFAQTKWADVAAAVGIGSTALYHYFESKQHCLYEIMIRTIGDVRERFDAIVAENPEWPDALAALLAAGFDLSEMDVLRRRVLLAEHGRIVEHRDMPREEAARVRAREEKRELERAWSAFLARGMEEGHLPAGDTQLLARLLLGLYNSVWSWYRSDGQLTLAEVGEFYVSRALALLGADPRLAAA